MTMMVRVLVFKPTYVGYTFQQQQNSRQSANQSVTVWSPSETTMNKKKKKRNIELKNFDGVLFSRSKSQEARRRKIREGDLRDNRVPFKYGTHDIWNYYYPIWIENAVLQLVVLGGFLFVAKVKLLLLLLSKILWRIRLLPVYRPVLLLFVLCKWTNL